MIRRQLSSPNAQSASFRTRARTVDHLGREQIADCPTAVSELWKNSWDAYSRNVKLRIVGAGSAVAVLTDDGHGMTPDDLFGKWLVVGTESKTSNSTTVEKGDRNGLKIRPRQGQKGIGRLSSAKLGSVLLLISKHRDHPFSAALMDWRSFENPHIDLDEVKIAAGTYDTVDAVLDDLTGMASVVASGIVTDDADWLDADPGLREGWAKYDQESKAQTPPSKQILNSLRSLPFQRSQLDEWGDTGTAMLVWQLDEGLAALTTGDGATDAVANDAARRFKETLSNFVDPYALGEQSPEFDYRVDIATADNSKARVLVGSSTSVDRTMVEDLEHQIEGRVGPDGVFRGRVKAFGKWVDGQVKFERPEDIPVARAGSTSVGTFDLFVASMEWKPSNTSHSAAVHQHFQTLAQQHAGFMMFRDGLRVMPYGREDNDFFEIEKRRSLNAGRYFWNHRQMFGRIAITRERNPNLKDKAGREGLIDNKAAQTMRWLVINILEQSAFKFFGTRSDLRKPALEEAQESYRQSRAKAEAKKLRARERKLFRQELEANEKKLPGLRAQVDSFATQVQIDDDDDIVRVGNSIAELRWALDDLSLRNRPDGLDTLRSRYDAVLEARSDIGSAISTLDRLFQDAVDSYVPLKEAKIVGDKAQDAITGFGRETDRRKQQVTARQKEQFDEVLQLADRRKDDFKAEVEAIVSRHSVSAIDMGEALDELTNLHNVRRAENRNLFDVYLAALETMKDQIDLEALAVASVEDLQSARHEIDRLTALAQLGIAVEVAAHDLADFDEMIVSGIQALPEKIRDTRAVRDIKLGADGLTDQLKFLSPLRLSGDKIRRKIEGREIFEFMRQFFGPALARAKISFSASERFLAAELIERPARVFPVFLNLINNSIYWVGTKPAGERSILLDKIDDELAVIDSGPGIAPSDRDDVFKLFFTRKQRGGRGVGLYLARANLAAGGHRIRYRNEDEVLPLDGAAFLIAFQGLSGE